MKKHLIIIAALIFAFSTAYAQNTNKDLQSGKNEKYLNWHNKDRKSDKVVGISTEKAYEELLKGQKPESVIVAVIDGGVDIYHEDLKDVIWINEDEIPGNGTDDDENGYTDDIYGWNFIGNAKGENVNEDNLEITRIYRKYKDRFADKKESEISVDEKDDYKMYKQAEEEYKNELEKYTKTLKNVDVFVKNYELTDKVLKQYLKKDTFTLKDLKNIETTNKDLIQVINFQTYALEKEINLEDTKEYLEFLNTRVNYHLNTDFDGRKKMGDDYEKMDGKIYGNNDVKGPRANHGTHVAGIIAASRHNGIGINGIADKVKLMVLRVVPDGDEHDKDIANAIMYAADNGADIINMSFGKNFSPYKEYVDEAVKYAEQKGVLIIHAAGNDSKNIDKEPNYPTDNYLEGEKASNWIEVGASSMEYNKNLCGEFSNYGAKNVDLFAPGVKIYSTLPENKYKLQDGTSMAGPVATGVAAVLKSYFPHLTALEIKEILIKSVSPFQKKKVYQPSEEEKAPKVRFGTLSVSGGIVNLYNAVNIAKTEYSK